LATSAISRRRSRSSRARSFLRLSLPVYAKMSAERAVYLDSSAIVKLAIQEPESAALRTYLRRRRPLVSSSLTRAEVARALAPLGAAAVRRGHDVLARIDLIRVTDRILSAAGSLQPTELRTLDAIHLATVHQIESNLSRIVTYDERLAAGARLSGWRVVAPS
jgi:predicted nucleic acid-binding protein